MFIEDPNFAGELYSEMYSAYIFTVSLNQAQGELMRAC